MLLGRLSTQVNETMVMGMIDRKKHIIFFEISDLTIFLNRFFKKGQMVMGFQEEVLLGVFLFRWFKKGKRSDSKFYIGFKYNPSHEKEIVDVLSSRPLTPEVFQQKYHDPNTLSDLVVRSIYQDRKDTIDLHIQIKTFPREDRPGTITQELIDFLETKKSVTPTDEILLIYSYYTRGLDGDKLDNYLRTYPYKSIVQVFWTDKNRLNFLKLKPATGEHYSLGVEEIFTTETR